MSKSLEYTKRYRQNKGITISESKLRNLEDKQQLKDAQLEGMRRGAKFYEYTDKNGKIHNGETGNTRGGGTYRTQYSEEKFQYSKMSTDELQAEQKRLKEQSETNYQIATRAAASRTGSAFNAMALADVRLSMINQILRRKKKKK